MRVLTRLIIGVLESHRPPAKPEVYDFLVTLIKMLQNLLGAAPHRHFSGAGEEDNGFWMDTKLIHKAGGDKPRPAAFLGSTHDRCFV